MSAAATMKDAAEDLKGKAKETAGEVHRQRAPRSRGQR